MGEKAIDYTMLYIPSFDILEIQEFHVVQQINEHAKMTFSAVLDDGISEDTLVGYTTVGYQLEAYCSDDRNNPKKKKLFQGIVTEVKVRNVDSLKYLYVTAYSNTFQMDVLKNSFSYQDTGETYKSLLGKVVKRTDKAQAKFSSEFDKATGGFLVQYCETDWQFLKRLASHFNLGLVPDMLGDKPQVWAGYAFGNKKKEMHVREYTTKKNIRSFQKDSQNSIQGVQEKSYVTYQVKSYDMLNVMDEVTFLGGTYYIKEAEYKMEGATIVGTYIVTTKDHFKRKKLVNREISGISLNGKVTEIIRDKVKIQLDIDPKPNAKYLFPYSTMSASPDGSGWYCMPKKGDEVRVYFPDTNDHNAFAISSVSGYVPDSAGGGGLAGGGASGGGGSGTQDRMGDPNVRYLRTPHGMEITLKPDGIIINAADGQGVITLDQEGNITISAAKNLKVTAEENVNIIAQKNVSINASEDIAIKGAQGSITLEKSGNTVVTGQFIAEN